MDLFASRLRILLLAVAALFCAQRGSAQIKTGANLTSQHPSAIIEIESTTQGFLLPRMTTAERLAIASPAEGLMVYSKADSCVWVFRKSLWRSQCDPANVSAWSIFGNANIVDGTNFLGTTNNVPLTLRVNANQIWRFNTNNSIQRDGAGNTRGAGANDFQIARSAATQAATGDYSTIAGGNGNTASGPNSAVLGGGNNSASANLATVGGGNGNTASNVGAFVGGGNVNTASGNISTVVGGNSNVASGSYAFVGSGSGNAASGESSVVGGGTTNQATAQHATVAGGFVNSALFPFSFVGGGANDTSYANYAAVVAGLFNYSGGVGGIVGAGQSNRITGGSSNGILTGYRNQVSASRSAILTGQDNTITGWNSGILGGYGLKMGDNSVGFSGYTADANKADVSSFANTAYFGDVDLWIGNVNNAAKGLRFYEPNASLTFSGANYTSFKAGAQATNLNYIWPLTGPTNGQGLISDASGNLSWASPSAFSWNLLGNAGTSAATNFLGTTDNVPLVFRMTNARSGYLSQTLTYFGYEAGLNNTAAAATFFGAGAGRSNTTGLYNVGIGQDALRANTTGGWNTALGQGALLNNSTSNYNTAVGNLALGANTTGTSNTAVGAYTMTVNTTGNENSAIGSNSLVANTTGSGNSAAGYGVLASNTTGSSNTALGNHASAYNVSGSSNTAVGFSASSNNPSGNNNSIFGYQAGYGSGFGVNNNNSFFGYTSGQNILTGSANTFIGAQTGLSNTTGSNNTLIGNSANVSSAALTNATAIGNNATVGASNSLVLGNAANVGIGISAPAYKLDVVGSNPLRLVGLLAGATTDSVLTSNAGVVRRLSTGQILANEWHVIGNSGIDSSANFIGTLNPADLVFRTNNRVRGHFDRNGGLFVGDSTQSIATTGGLFRAQLNSNNASTATIAVQGVNQRSINATNAGGGLRAVNGATIPTVASGVSATGLLDGGNFQMNRTGASDLGSVSDMAGTRIYYGHSTGVGATATTTTAYGLFINPNSGGVAGNVITNMYDLFLATPTTVTGTVTNRFGIYQQYALAKNYFAGNTGIGTAAAISPTSTLHVAGSISTAFRRVAANVTLDATDHIVLVNCTAAGRTLTLPAASTCSGREYVVGKTDETVNALNFSTALRLTETTSVSSLTYAKKYKIVSDGTDWWIFSE